MTAPETTTPGMTNQAMTAQTIAAQAFVAAHGVEKTFTARHRAPTQALLPTDFAVAAGEFVSIVGPSGCGKSTLLSLIAGLDPVTAGTITIDGTTVTKPYADLGMAFQRDLLLEWRTVLDNVLLQVDVRREKPKRFDARARQLLDQVGLGGRENRYPRELSGGMRQRVALCRALLRRPRLLLMDEPFGALDALTRDQIALDLQGVVTEDGRTAVLVTHSIQEAVFMSDRVWVMSPGPGRILDDIAIDLPRPRALKVREEPRFTEYVNRILEIFITQGALHERVSEPVSHG
jgi:NitT/TauT family transport system ATP-binding protein